MTDNTQINDVREFSETFGHPVRLGKPTLDRNEIDDETLKLRISLIAEEFFELIEATYGSRQANFLRIAFSTMEDSLDETSPRDIVETADALGDLLYVINGGALTFGIDLPAVFSEIHRSNMTKLGSNGLPIRSNGSDGHPVGKILKGPSYEAPRIAKVLGVE